MSVGHRDFFNLFPLLHGSVPFPVPRPRIKIAKSNGILKLCRSDSAHASQILSNLRQRLRKDCQKMEYMLNVLILVSQFGGSQPSPISFPGSFRHCAAFDLSIQASSSRRAPQIEGPSSDGDKTPTPFSLIFFFFIGQRVR